MTVAAPGGAARADGPPVDLDIAPGRMVALTGRSGRGQIHAAGQQSRDWPPPLSGRIASGGVDLCAVAGTRACAPCWGFFLPPSKAALVSRAKSATHLAPRRARREGDAEMWALLTAPRPRPGRWRRDGGLDLMLGEGGQRPVWGRGDGAWRWRACCCRPPRVLLHGRTGPRGWIRPTAASVLAAIRGHLCPKAPRSFLTTHRARATLRTCDDCLGF